MSTGREEKRREEKRREEKRKYYNEDIQVRFLSRKLFGDEHESFLSSNLVTKLVRNAIIVDHLSLNQALAKGLEDFFTVKRGDRVIGGDYKTRTSVYSGGSFPGGRFIQEKYEILEGTETSDVTSYRTSIEGEAVVFI